jgi:hypothetical protein
MVPVFDLAAAPGADLAGVVPPQTITCLPGKSFCVDASFNRATTGVGTAVDLASPGTGNSFLYSNGSAQSCSGWTGTMRIDSDLPDWSVTINATCASGTMMGTQVIGTMSGSE